MPESSGFLEVTKTNEQSQRPGPRIIHPSKSMRSKLPESSDLLSPGQKRTFSTFQAEQQEPPEKSLSKTSQLSFDQLQRKFYDSLSTLWLTRRALREIDRRNDLIPARAFKVNAEACAKEHLGDIKRFARQGGPNFSDIRQVYASENYQKCFTPAHVAAVSCNLLCVYQFDNVFQREHVVRPSQIQVWL